MEKRIRALKAIILVVVMIVELFGVDAVRVVAETINVTGDTTISTEDNRDYAVTDCTLTVSSTGNITGTVYGSGGKIVNQGSISKIERNIEVDNQAGASIQDLQSSVGITNAGHITSATYSSTYTLTNSGTIDTLNVQNPGYSGSTATVNMNAGTISSLNVTNYSGMNPVINYAGGTITSLFAEGTNGADLVVSGSHEISQLKGTVNVSGSGMLTVSGALQLEKGYTGEKLGVTKDTGRNRQKQSGLEIQILTGDLRLWQPTNSLQEAYCHRMQSSEYCNFRKIPIWNSQEIIFPYFSTR